MGSPAASSMPVGYRFHPTDEELVGHYLMYKLLLGDESRVQDVIAEVDVCKFEPWDLPAFSKVKSDDHEWFFFSPRDLKYTNSNRSNRATNAGYWKATGKDRNIKTRGTNNVIGTKKTLVFHKGRVPHGVKTNWVIHEYHAVTFPVDMRAFVLCRLIEKAEKRTDELINEGEPIAADHENQASADRIPDVYTLPEVTWESIFLAPPQADECDFPSLQYSPIITNREPFQDSTFTNICFEDENNITQFPFDTTEDEDDVDLFLNSTLVDEDVVISEERRDAFVNDSTPSQSLGQVYYESSETDVELVSAQYGNVSGTTSACKHAVSSRLQSMRMVDTPQDVVYAGPVSLSSTTKVNREKKNGTFGDNFGGVDLSDDSTANKPLSVSVIKNFSSPSPPRATSSSSSTSRRSKSKYHPRSDNFVSRRAAPRSQTQRKVSIAVSQHEVQKETRMLESNKDQRKAYDAKSRKNSETSCNQSSCVNEKGSFIDLKAPSISHNPNPRSLYLVNVIIGFSLLIVTIWDMVSFGKLC